MTNLFSPRNYETPTCIFCGLTGAHPDSCPRYRMPLIMRNLSLVMVRAVTCAWCKRIGKHTADCGLDMGTAAMHDFERPGAREGLW